MQTVHIIRHKVLVEGISVQQVARDLGLSRTTVYKYLEVLTPSRAEAAPRRHPVLDAVASRIDTLLAEWHSRTTAKQRLTAARIHRQLLTEARRSATAPCASTCVRNACRTPKCLSHCAIGRGS